MASDSWQAPNAMEATLGFTKLELHAMIFTLPTARDLFSFLNATFFFGTRAKALLISIH
jgi:hypothetical protein